MLRALATIVATAVLVGAAPATAATLSTDPLLGTEPVVKDAGSVAALSGYADPGGDELRVAIHAEDAGPCAPTAAADPGPLSIDTHVTDEYSVDVPLSGALGRQLLCVWLERDGAAAAAPLSVGFSVVAPAAKLDLGPPVVAHRGLPFSVGLFAGSEGAGRRVVGTLVPGTACPAGLGAAPAGVAAFPPAGLSLASAKDQTTVRLAPTAPGDYRLCAWIQPPSGAAEAAAVLPVTVPTRRTRTATSSSGWVRKRGAARAAVFVEGAISGTVVIEAATDVVGSPFRPVKRFSIAGWRHRERCHAICELSTSDHHVRVHVPVGFKVRARFLGTRDAAPSLARWLSVMPW